MKTFPLIIVTPDGKPFEGEAVSLLVRTRQGDVQILAGHTDLIAALDTGKACLRTATEERYAALSGGFVTIESGRVTVVCVTFEYADDIDVARAERAKERAAELQRNAKSAEEIERAKAKLARALIRLHVADL